MRHRWVALLAAGALALCPSCARTPANTTTGARLVVTVKMAGPINDNYQYFFLIRNANDPSGQNGPIAVIAPPYNNGFATGQNTLTPGFTDFVEYSGVQRQLTTSHYAVYHLVGGMSGDPNQNVFNGRGEPVATLAPAGGNLLQFQLALSQITPDPGNPDPNNGQTPRYLQVNFIATTTTPNDPQNIDPNKYVDAFGDQSQLGSGFITIDCSQIGRTYLSNDTPGDPYYEPTGDVYPTTKDPAVDIAQWSIQITQH